MRTHVIAFLAFAATGTATAQNPPVFFNEVGSPITSDSMDSRAIRPADFDGDGDVDLFVANFGQTNVVYRNNGGGSFTIVPPFSLNTQPDDSFDGAWGDMDGDGDLDLVVANGSKDLLPGNGIGKDNSLWINMGPLPDGAEGRFEQVLTGPVVSDKGETYAVAWVDLDGDGDLDLVFANRFQENFMYLNDGTGQFTKVTTGPFVTDFGTSRDVTAGDLDLDGDMDLVVANSNGQAVAVYLNQGGLQAGSQGEFVRQLGGLLAADTGSAYGVNLGDYDNDGYPDLFVTRRHGEQNMLYRNTGDGQWERMLALAPSLDFGDSYASAWGDLDRDGYLDLYVTNRDEGNFLYLNDGVGGFKKVTWGEAATDVGDSRDVALADVDNDGQIDILVANTLGGDDRFYRNRGRAWKDEGFAYHPASTQPVLAGAGWLAPSTPMTYSVTLGPANRPAILFAGLTTAFIPFKGGTLVPSPDISVPGFVTDAAGQFEFITTFPASVPPGLSMFHQVWIQDDDSVSGVSATNGLSLLTP